MKIEATASPLFVFCLTFVFHLFASSLVSSQGLAMQTAADVKSGFITKQVDRALQEPLFEHRLVVKFRDEVRARARQGELRSLSDYANRFGEQMVLQHGVRFKQLIQLDADRIEQLESRALARSGRPQPDLASMMVVQAPQQNLQQIANALLGNEFVEWVEFELLHPEPPVIPDGTDIAPATPVYETLQGYRRANPGLNMDAFWEMGNARGAGIKLADCEYWFNEQHEDICGVISEPGQTPNPTVISNNWHQHGTAALGESIGGDNNFGILGLAPDAEAYFFPEWTIEGGSRRITAIANAIATVDPGDVVLLEMQTSIGFGFGPAELNNSVWNVVKAGTDAGVIVVAAAGNGNQNLDSSDYAQYTARGDSGAIMVGAGSPTLSHNKLSFSTFGSRLDVQAWGQSVFTTGYGSFSVIGGDENQNYANGFSGTSSASALIAGVCVSLQSFAAAEIGRRLTPEEMRQVLRETGWPQGSGGNIGTFPNMVEAGERVLEFAPEFQLGDVNRDGQVNLLDVSPFVDLIGNSGFQVEADINQDGSVDLLDIAPFVSLLNGV